MIDGPRLPPPAGGKPDSLLVLLHGYGADGNDLIDIGNAWARVLPRTAVVSPHAPRPCPGSPMGREWFPLTLRDEAERWNGVVMARPALDAFLDAELARLGLADDRLVLAGFSQGTMMALHVGLRRPKPPVAILGYSGLLAGPEHIGEATGRPPVLLVHGDRDEVIPAAALFQAADALGKAEIPVRWHLSRGVAHGIDQEGLALGGRFVQAALGPTA